MFWSTVRRCAPRGAAWLVGVAAGLLVVVSSSVDANLYRGATPGVRPSIDGASVTLITGDRVQLRTRAGGGAIATVIPAAGREGIGFVHRSRTSVGRGEEISVIPSDAVPLLAAGLLDPELFNVTGLVLQGLASDDGTGPPLIVTFDAARTGAAAVSLADAAVTPVQVLASINGVAVAHAKGSAGPFWQWLTGGGGAAQAAAVAARRASSPGLAAGVAKVWLDGRAQPLLDQSGPQIGVPRARQLGLTGNGVTIAVLDSGIKADHPDFAGRIGESRDFTGSSPTASDEVGHGTHVASIAAGSGEASGGRYQGVAPRATLLNGKVCLVFGCPFSAIIAGMEWAAPRARIINLSLGGSATDGTDPLSLALNTLSLQHGTLFVVAAGNSGAPQSVGSPASAQEAFAVGSATKQDTISTFSSRGPRVRDFAIKPDLVAPGTAIVAARAPGTPVGDDDPVDAQYSRLSGTSMAAPHVAGAAALVAEAHPDWTSAQIRAALTSSATPLAGATVYDQGAGRLDVGRAVSQTVFARGSLSFGLVRWPQDQPVSTRPVTYTNVGDAPVTLQLALQVTDATGAPAPPGLYTLDASTLTVPAHGTADLHVTFDPLDRTPGLFGGRLIAASETQAVLTPVGAFQEVESYDLTIRAVGRAPSFAMFGFAVGIGDDNPFAGIGLDTANPTVTVRLPKGQYQVNGAIFSMGLPTEPLSQTLASEPAVALDADRTVVLDATRGRRVSAQIDQVSAELATDSTIVASQIGPNEYVSLGVATAFGNPFPTYAVPTAPVTGRTFAFVYEPVMGVRQATDFSALYNLGIFVRGRIPEQLAFRARAGDLARVRTDYHAQGLPASASRFDFAFAPDIPMGISRSASPFALPARRTEYFTAAGDVEWMHSHSTGGVRSGRFSIDFEDSADVTYRPGSVQSVGWNRAPLGPAHGVFGSGSGRREGSIVIQVAPYSGNQARHSGSISFFGTDVTGTTTLSRDGMVVGTTTFPCAGSFPAPAQPGRYTLTCSSTRNVFWSTLGTRTEGTFTFNDPGPTAGAQSLPLLVVRATGAVFGLNDAPAGRLFPLFLHVERPERAVDAPIAALQLDVSYDEGATWTRALVFRLPGSNRAVALLVHPRTPGFVSLRAHAADTRGNSATHTMIRAYGLVHVP